MMKWLGQLSHLGHTFQYSKGAVVFDNGRGAYPHIDAGGEFNAGYPTQPLGRDQSAPTHAASLAGCGHLATNIF